MKLLKILKWLNPLDPLKTIFQSKKSKRENFLVQEYEAGRILQVDNGIDNKKNLLKLEK